MSKQHDLNAISLWVPALIDIYQETEGIWDKNVNLDEQVLIPWTEKM